MSRIRSRVSCLVGLCAVAIGCTRLTPEQQVVHDAARAIGGEAAVQQAALVTMSGTGRQFNLGQDLRPGLANQTFAVSAYTRAYDTARPRMRVTQTRTPNFAYFQGPQAQTQTQGVDGEVAYNVGASGTATRASTAVAADRRAERYHHPVVLLRAALADGATLAAAPPQSVADPAERAVSIETEAGTMVLAVNAQGQPARIVSAGSHPNLGDVQLTTTFADYAPAGPLLLPTRMSTRVDEFTTGEYDVAHTVEAAAALGAPTEVAGTPAPGTPAVNVAVEELAPGVWSLAGQSHHSVVVAFRDRLVMIEAPQSEARSLAAIARARELRPGTPLTHLVMSHHHFDHSTGLRAAIAQGLTILAHEGNAEFVAAMAARPFTRMPDTLARTSAAKVQVEAVGEVHTIRDGIRTLELHHVAGNPHSETMLMAYLPAERLLVEVDAFSPGGAYHPYAANLLAHIERLKLRVDRIVPLHGKVVPLKDLMAAARPAG